MTKPKVKQEIKVVPAVVVIAVPAKKVPPKAKAKPAVAAKAKAPAKPAKKVAAKSKPVKLASGKAVITEKTTITNSNAEARGIMKDSMIAACFK